MTQGILHGEDVVDLRPGHAGSPSGVNPTSINRQRIALARSGDAVRKALEYNHVVHKKSSRRWRGTVALREHATASHPSDDRLLKSGHAHGYSSLGELSSRLLRATLLARAEYWIGLFRSADSNDFPEELARVQISRRVAEQFFARAIERDEIVDDVILGTKIDGSGHVSGNIRCIFEPSTNQIRLNLVFTGVCRSQTRGLNDVVILQNTAETQFQAQKQLVWGPQGLTALPATATAETHSTTGQISSTLPGLRGWVATQIAGQRVAESRTQANAISSQHSADKVRRALDAQVDRSLASIRFMSAGVAASGSIRRTTWLEVSSTPDALQIVVHRRGASAAATKATVAALPAGCDMAVQVHREMLRSIIREPMTLLIGLGIFERVRTADARRPAAAPVSSGQPSAWQFTGSRDSKWLVVQHASPVFPTTVDARRASAHVPVKSVATSPGSIPAAPAAEIR